MADETAKEARYCRDCKHSSETYCLHPDIRASNLVDGPQYVTKTEARENDFWCGTKGERWEPIPPTSPAQRLRALAILAFIVGLVFLWIKH